MQRRSGTSLGWFVKASDGVQRVGVFTEVTDGSAGWFRWIRISSSRKAAYGGLDGVQCSCGRGRSVVIAHLVPSVPAPVDGARWSRMELQISKESLVELCAALEVVPFLPTKSAGLLVTGHLVLDFLEDFFR